MRVISGFRLFLPSLIVILFSCTSVRDFNIVQGPDGISRVKLKAFDTCLPSNCSALRASDSKVITDEKVAEKELASLRSMAELEKRLVKDCKETKSYLSSVSYHKALQLIDEGKLVEAKENLEKAKTRCPKITHKSKFHYLMAKIERGLGNKQKSKEELEKFLAFSESTYPAGFYESDDDKIDPDMKSAREEAKKALADEKMNIPQKTVNYSPRMKPGFFYLPGGENKFAPLFIFGGGWRQYENMTSLMLDIPTPYLSVMSLVEHGSKTGYYLGLKLRKTLYESYSRNFMFGASLMVRQEKSGIYYSDGFLGYMNSSSGTVTVTDSYIAYIPGIGMTYRFIIPSIGVSAEYKKAFAKGKESGNGEASLFGFYEFVEWMNFHAGINHNKMVAGFTMLWFDLNYVFERKEFTWNASVAF